jgi:D-glycero-alpha-D-manno-heptose-7-phosphate kinase
MLMTRTPVRIPLGGGGTDLPFYARERGGFLITAAIDKYIYIIVNKHFEKNFRICYSKREIVETANEVKHPVVREAMKLLGLKGGVEIVSLSDVPSNSGLGTSSSFTVGMISAISTYQKIAMTKHEIAEMAVKIERELLKEAGGVQDQYIAAFGGICTLEMPAGGKDVIVSPLRVSHATVKTLEKNLLFFSTSVNRDSWKIQKEIEATHKANPSRSEIFASFDRIKDIGLRTKDALMRDQTDEFGRLLNEHWEFKKRLSSQISSSFIDKVYDGALKAGAMGGKLMGAGGGGYFMFYCRDKSAAKLKDKMRAMGLGSMPFKFDFQGTSLVACDANSAELAPE